MALRLHVGCGLVHRPGWINLDLHECSAADLLGDALRLPFADRSAESLASLQLVEHLGYVATLYALYEWARVLRPGGTLEIETPDRTATLEAVIDQGTTAPALPWLFGTEQRGMRHRYLFAAGELGDLVHRAGFEAVAVERFASMPGRPALRLSARRAADTAATQFAIDLHRAWTMSGLVDPTDAPPYMAELETLVDRAVPLVERPGGEALTRLLSLSLRYGPRVAAGVLEALTHPESWPSTELDRARGLVAALQREQFTAHLACRWRTMEKSVATADAAWARLEREISLYLAARLCPGEGLDAVRAGLETGVATQIPTDRAVDLFCQGALAAQGRHLTARGVRSFARGDLDGAERAFRSALGYDPRALWPRWNLARLYLGQGRPLEALGAYEALQANLPAGFRPALEGEIDTLCGRADGVVGTSRGPIADLGALFEEPAAREPGVYALAWPDRPEAQELGGEAEAGEAGPSPSLACCVWELTLRCNLHCLHCGATAGRARPDELSPAEAQRVADQLARLPAGEVTLMGGEIFLRPDWLAVAERLRAAGVELVVFTNATLLNPERIAQLQALAPRSIGTSLDGGCPEVHDQIRGVPGAFERTLAGIDALQTAGLRVAVITTLTRRNLYELPAIARLLAGRGIRWQIQIAGAGGARLDRADLLRPLEFYFAAQFIARMRATYPWSVLPVIGAHDVGYCSTRLPSLAMPGQVWAGCSAGRSVLGICSNGAVKPCLSLPETFVVGSLRERSLAELWEGDVLAAWRRPAPRHGFCAHCPHGERCEGGCTDLAVTYSGRRGENPLCLYRIEQMALTL